MQERNKKKILVIRLSSLGDVVLTTVIFPNLRAKFPDAEIHVLTKNAFAEVFDHNPNIDQVIVFDPTRQPFSELTKEIRSFNYDVIIDLHSNLRSWLLRFVSGPPIAIAIKKHRLARTILLMFKKTLPALERSVRERILDCLIPLEAPVVSDKTQLFPKNPQAALITYNLEGAERLIGIAPGAQHNTKRWSPENFAEVANRLGAIPKSLIVILGDKKDQAVVDRILPLLTVPYKNLTGWTSISDLIAVISKLNFLLTNDSGIMHVAEALNVPLVALFGPTVRGFGFFPYQKTSRVVEVMGLNCRPCTMHGDEVCPLGHHKCMVDLDPNAVAYAASDAMESQ